MNTLRAPVNSLACLVVVSLLTQLSAGQVIGQKEIALRHNRSLEPGGSWFYRGDFQARIQVAGAQSVDLMRPDGGLTPLRLSENPEWWIAREFADLPAFDSRFADGVYQFRVTLPNATVLEVSLDTRAIPMPGEYPELSGVLADEQWQALRPLPLQWQLWTLNRQGDDVKLFVENQSDGNNQIDYVAPIAPGETNHVVPGAVLPDNSRFHTWVHFANWATNAEVVKQTASHIDFHTGTPQEVYGFDIDLMQDWMPLRHGNWFRYFFEAQIDASGATRVSVTTPAKPGFPEGEAFDLQPEPVGTEWLLGVFADSPEALTARFPDGVYTYTVWFINGSNTTVNCEAVAAWPPSYPQATPQTLSPQSTVDPAVPLTISWAPWVHTNTTDHKVILFTVNQEGDDQEIIDLELPADATSYTIPPGTLQPGGRYFVTVEFESFVGDGNDKDRALILQYSTTPFIVPESVHAPAVGQFQFEISSLPAAVLDIQASTNLTHWDTIHTITNVTGFTWFTNTTAGLARRFYRLLLLEPPMGSDRRKLHD